MEGVVQVWSSLHSALLYIHGIEDTNSYVIKRDYCMYKSVIQTQIWHSEVTSDLVTIIITKSKLKYIHVNICLRINILRQF